MKLKPHLKSLLAFLLQLPIVRHFDGLLQFLPRFLQQYLTDRLGYQGELLSVNNGSVEGWAWCRYKPNLPIAVDIYNAGTHLATVMADLPQEAEFKNEAHGFHYQLPEALNATASSLIRVQYQGTEIELKHHHPKMIGNHTTEMILTDTPWVHSPFFESLLASKCENEAEQQIARQFHEQGYVVIEDVLTDELIQQIIETVTPLFDPNTADGPRSYYRVQDAWKETPIVRALAANEKIYHILKFLYEREPRPFQTLNFQYGTQQRGHADFIHFSSLPAQYMCGVWVALEDMHAENGPLFYYPGSHQEPGYTYYDIILPRESKKRGYEDFVEQLMTARKYRKQELHVKKGSALIWSSNLVHGGSPILKPGSTRWSQVTHYFFENCLYYSPRDSSPITGDYSLLDLEDVKTGQPLQQTYNGLPLQLKNVGNGRYRIFF